MAYKKFIFDGVQIERSSPLEALQKQLRGYNMSGIYHVGIRDNNMNLFKLQHMALRVPADSRVGAKYNLVERQMMDALCSIAPRGELRDKARYVIFRAGDYRSTLDTNLLERSSNVREKILEVQVSLLEKLQELKQSSRGASRTELMNAMLHYFIGCSISLSEVGDLSLDKIPDPRVHNFGLHEDDPIPIYTSRSSCTILPVNLGNFIRGGKRTVPSVFRDVIDESMDEETVCPLVKSLAQSKSHLFCLCEAATLNEEELSHLKGRGWTLFQNPAKDLMVASRTNEIGSSITQLAGSKLKYEDHAHLSLSYMICEIEYGYTLPLGSSGFRGDFDEAVFARKLTRAGSEKVRVCVFHITSSICCPRQNQFGARGFSHHGH